MNKRREQLEDLMRRIERTDSAKNIADLQARINSELGYLQIQQTKLAINEASLKAAQEALRAQKEEADAWLGKGATWEGELLRVTATGSNDSGVSWVIETDGERIFHAGDLNNWYARFLTDDYHGGLVYSPDFGIDIDPAKEEKRFLGELKDIRKLTDRFDVVMFPVDGRIGNGYTRGARQFLDVFRTGLFVPMHFVASGFESAWRMKEFTDAKSVTFWCIRREGECCEVKEIIAQASR